MADAISVKQDWGHSSNTVAVDMCHQANVKQLVMFHHECGAGLYAKTGDALPPDVVEAAGAADAVLLGAMGLPDVRYPDGREITPQIDLREIFGLYGGVRPAKALPGVPPVLADPRAADIDFILIRESTEGLFVGRKKAERIGDEVARDIMYFFAALAMLAALCDWRTLVVAAAVAAVHHLSLNFLLPYAVFPDGGDFFRVVLHGAP